jgi:hypothetical protein
MGTDAATEEPRLSWFQGIERGSEMLCTIRSGGGRIYKETRAWPALVVSLDGRPHHALRDADRGPRFRLPVKMACRGSRVADVWVRDGFEKLPVDLETLDRCWFGSTGSR